MRAGKHRQDKRRVTGTLEGLLPSATRGTTRLEVLAPLYGMRAVLLVL